MANINYEIKDALFPFDFGFQHLEAFSQEVEWNGRAVCHLILGILEVLPGINYIIAIFDAIINYAPQAPALPQNAPQAPVPPQNPPEIKLEPFYYLTNHKPRIVFLILASTCCAKDACEIVADYLVKGTVEDTAIGSQELEKIYGVKTAPLELGPEFYDWWWARDAHDRRLALGNPAHKIRLNCETHYPPVFRPESVTRKDTKVEERLTIGTMGRLAENTKEGYNSSRYNFRTHALTQNEQSEAGAACYIAMRREVLGRNNSLAEQIQLMQGLNAHFNAGYEEENSALDVVFVAFTIHAFTGVRPLGDATGAEGRYTLSRCSKDKVQFGNSTYPVAVGYFSPSVVGGPRLSGGLSVSDDFDFANDDVGVSGLRKFQAIDAI